jgi:type 1 glutamine amidotransferase/nicotinamidase-related amidase
MKKISLLLCLIAGLAGASSSQERFELTLRTRGLNDGVLGQERVAWDARKTAMIVCDMWDKHWCNGATRRVAEMAGRMNKVAAEARRRGALIIHAPSACMDFYKEHPARRRATDAPLAKDAPEFLKSWAKKLPSESKASWPVDQKDGGCDCRPVCRQARAWKRQIGVVEIEDCDAITDSGIEVWNLLSDKGIDNVIVMGVHTNMCVIGRPFGLRNLRRAGKNVVLMRDMTDTMYNSRSRPFVKHYAGTDLVVAYIERHVCPTITSAQIAGGTAFCFEEDDRPHAVFLIGEREYGTRHTVPAFAEEELLPRNVRSTCVFSASDTDSREKHDFPGFEALKTADLVFVSMRRRGLKPQHLDMLRAHLDAGKPLMGIRTASHAFHTRGKHPEGRAGWEKFDPEVLGGNYKGHHGKKPRVKVTVVDAAEDHPILKGVKGFSSPGSLYRVRPLAKTAVPLLTGAIPDAEPEPVAWTNTYGKSRIFYTSLGHADDFNEASFNRMLVNALFWALDRPAPD